MGVRLRDGGSAPSRGATHPGTALLLGALLGALLELGCAAPQRPRASGVPASPAEPRSGGDRHRGRVAPPDPATATTVSLDQLLAYAEDRAPAVRVGRGRAALGQAEIAAASPLLPDNPDLTTTLGGRVIGPGTFFELEVSLDQRFEIAGERGLRLEAARAAAKLARVDLEAARWQVHAEVHALFYRALLARERLEAADRVVELASALLGIAERRAAAGQTAPFTLIVARAELAQARQRRISTQQRGAAAELALAAVVGWPAGRLPPLVGELPAVRRAPGLEQLVALALDHHPSLRRAALAVRAADARVRLEDREAWPEPALGVTYAREGGQSPADNLWLGTLSVPLPIWQRNQGGRARARAERGIAYAERDALGATLRARLARAASAVDAAAARVEIYGADILPAFERNLTLIKRAYELGEIDIHEVSQIRERVLSTQQQALDALDDYYRAVAELEAMLGTDIWPATDEQ